MLSEVILELKCADIGYQSPLIEDANAFLKSGEVTLLTGDNGTGKSTLIRTILGQQKLLAGEILLDGKNKSLLTAADIAHKIAVVFSRSTVPAHYTVTDLISLGRFIHYPYYFWLNEKDKRFVKEVIERLQLQDLRNTPLQQLSDGNLQKAYIGRALVQDTPIIILDEPTTHLDDTNKQRILNLLYDLATRDAKAILFSSHDKASAIRISHHAWTIKNGSLQSALPEDLSAHNLDAVPKNIQRLPTVNASDFDRQLLYRALQKHIGQDLSNFHISRQSDFWLLKRDHLEYQFSTISALIAFLKENI